MNVRTHTSPHGTARRHTRITGRRGLRRSVTDAGQTAIVMVVAMSVLLMSIGAILVQQTVDTAPLLQANSIQHYAYRALQAGMNSYQSVVNTNPNLANCNSGTNATALCNGAKYNSWNLVAGTNSGNGVIPEWYLFGNPQPVFATDGSLSSLQVQVVGAAGYGTHYAYQSSVANMSPNNDYLKDVWWTDYEAADTLVNNPQYKSGNICKYDWQTGYTGSGSICNSVYFGPGDTINGPVFSNDSIYVSNGPNFGTAGNPATVTTGDPTCLFVDPSCPLSNSGDVGIHAAIPPSSVGHALETNPSDVSSLALVASEASPNNGCVYYGPTTVTLSGTQMTVKSPDTVTPSANCPVPGGAAGSLPPNGVLYVENAVKTGNPNSQVVTGANPFDDSSQGGTYAQTCSNYNISIGMSSYNMPCYFGWTGSATQDSEGDAFVSGNLAASATVPGDLTIATDNDIIIDGNLTYTDCTGQWTGTAHESPCKYQTNTHNDSLGLIATNDVDVDHPIYPNTPGTLLPVCGSAQAASYGLTAPLCQPLDASNNITIDATILALNQSFWVDNFASGSQLGNIIIYGSVQQEARGTVAIQGTSGFTKYYSWDPRLELVSPPSYLTPGTPSYLLGSSAISPLLTCPLLFNVYGTAGTTTCPVVP